MARRSGDKAAGHGRAQIPLPLEASQPVTDDLIPAAANLAARQVLGAWPDWSTFGALIFGPSGSGKSCLAAGFASQHDFIFLSGPDLHDPDLLTKILDTQISLVVDDADQAPEDALFHLFNHCKSQGLNMLLTSSRSLSGWDVGLEDLMSRLRTLQMAEIEGPDDDLIEALIMRRFADRQLKAPVAVTAYLATRVERTYRAIDDLVAAIDEHAMAEGRNVTLPLVRDVLEGND